MKLLTKEQREKLLKNGAANAARLAEPDNEGEHMTFTPSRSCSARGAAAPGC